MNNLFLRIQDKSVLIISGCIAKKGKSSLSWTVNDLPRSQTLYYEDCNSLAINPNRVRPTMKKMPYKSAELDAKPNPDRKIQVINVGKFYENKEKFLEILW